MEHSALHALQLCGLVFALAGPWLVLIFLRPAARKTGAMAEGALLERIVARWAWRGGFVAALGVGADFFIQAAEIEGRTVFGGVKLAVVWSFITETSVGRLELARLATLACAAICVRARWGGRWWASGILALAATLLAALVSHAAAQPTVRGPLLAGQIAHLLGAAAWIGVLGHLLAARKWLEATESERHPALVAEIIQRFSPVALTAAGLIAASGTYGLVCYLKTPAATFDSAYGLTFLVKLSLLVPLVYAGFVNYRRIRPGLMAAAHAGVEKSREWLRRFGRMLELEVTSGVLVITVAGILGSISPPGPGEVLRLTNEQSQALRTPDLPTVNIARPESFYDAETRTVDDLRYSEFTHNWSGVMVTLLGLCWLLQSAGGRWAGAVGRFWPFLLVPFALFVLVASDPEVWLMRKVNWREVVGNPQLLEHQLGAAMIMLMIWLGWRDGRNPPERRPLGYALPVIMAAGSLLLMGHAHNNLAATEELTTLINVQHVIFGAFGLAAGVLRWLSLRGLIPTRRVRYVWPALVMGLGLFMVFCYREVVPT